LASGLQGGVAPAFRMQALRGYRRTLEMDDADLEERTDSGSGTRNRRRTLDLDDDQLGGTESLSDWGKGQDREQPGVHTPREKCLNQVTLLGRIGQDPQIRGSQAKPVTTFSLATNSSWKDEFAEWQNRTEWHRITVFKPSLQDAVYNFLTKGARVHVSGRLMYGEITDQQGVKQKTTTIAADEIIFLGKQNKN